MAREKNDPDDLGRQAADARLSQQDMYDSLSNLAESFEQGKISPEEFKDKIGNLEDRFGVFIEGAEEDYDNVEQFAEALNEDVTSVSLHYHESDNSSVSRRKTLGMAASVLGAGLIGDGLNLAPGDSDYGGGFRFRDEPSGDIDIFGVIGDQERPSEQTPRTPYQIQSATIDDSSEIGKYLSGLSRREQEEWETILNSYDEETNEFFSDEDLNFSGITIRYNPDEELNSKYRAEVEMNGDKQYSDWQTFEHEETAKEALRHFGELGK